MSGTLERLPGLRLVLAHGGGSLPFIAARMDHAYAVRPECREAIHHRPSTYLRRMYFDTITHGDEPLRFLIEAVGPDRVLLGTDYPYDMADAAPVRRLSRLRLAADDEAAIGHENARRLLRLNDRG
jgi:aminocarboxymuconate-semialdehyde decarboxylase